MRNFVFIWYKETKIRFFTAISGSRIFSWLIRRWQKRKNQLIILLTVQQQRKFFQHRDFVVTFLVYLGVRIAIMSLIMSVLLLMNSQIVKVARLTVIVTIRLYTTIGGGAGSVGPIVTPYGEVENEKKKKKKKDRKSTRLNSSHEIPSRMPSSA
eukprot:TRINITY_DN204_c0_g3_i2.p1 TRINITY_DN204_c0_g3~~TRINITY_DN204_c0_g3_i2.p1  ORF type:complete len:154 (+),score=10.47 TRINITY_DN204_c0_g3_i2:570-1031(+)